MSVQVPQNDEINFCVKYYSQLYNASDTKENATKYTMDQLQFLSDVDLCSEDEISVDITDKIVVVPVPSSINNSSNCSLDEQAQRVVKEGGQGMILQDSNFNSKFDAQNYTEDKTVVAALYKENDKRTLKKLSEDNPSAVLWFTRPVLEKQMDWSLVVILVMACFCVSVGSACGGYSKMDM